MRPRVSHSAVMFGSGPDFRVVVIFGGEHGGSLSDTTLLLIGRYKKSVKRASRK